MTGLCLWAGTLAGHPLATRIRAAGRAGYTSLSVSPAELAEVVASGAQRRLAADLAAYGLRLGCLDPVAAWRPDVVPAHPAHRAHAAVSGAECLELAERFGVRYLNVIDVSWRPLPPDAGAHLAGYAERAARHGAAVVVEAQVYSGIPTVAAAARLCRDAEGRAALLVDAWHLFRGAGDVAGLAGLPVGAVQWADGPARAGADPVAESLTGRRMPGTGDFPLADLAAATAGAALAGPEVFAAGVPAAEVVARARAAAAHTRSVLAAAARV